MSELHTKEPWRVGRLTHPRYFATVKETIGPHQVAVDVDEWPLVIADCNINFPEDAKANARRIVACVNACAGIPIDMLEAMPSGPASLLPMYARLENQRDELMAALVKAEEWLSGWGSADPYLTVIRSTIASVKGGAL